MKKSSSPLRCRKTGLSQMAGPRMNLAKASAIALLAGSSAAMGQNVLLLVADNASTTEPVRDSLLATGMLTSVDIYPFATTLPTPTLAELQMYDAVITWTNLSYADGAAMGDVLADYVDAGGGVVCAVYCVSTTTTNRSLTGRWETGGYDIIPQRSGNTSTTTGLGTVHQPAHPLWNGMTTFTGVTNFVRALELGAAPHALRVADWDTGGILAATSTTFPSRVDLNFYPTAWHSTPDGARLLANGLVVAATGGSTDPGGCCFGDGSCQILPGVDCFAQGGNFRGPNTDCIDPCPEPAACCFPDGSCDVILEVACNTQGGTFDPSSPDCIIANCPQPATGACCLANGTCVIVWEGGCIAQGGLYQGDNTDCTITCPSRIDAHWNAASNAGTTDGGAYFLVEATEPTGIEIAGFDINTNAVAGTPITAHVYFRPVTFVGFTGDQSAWILMGEVPTTAAGPGNPTPVPIGGLNIAGGETWALRVGSSVGVRYNSNATTDPTFSDGNVILHMGEVQNNFFGTTTFGNYLTNDLRGWNGSMYYHVGATVITGACCLPSGACEEMQEVVCTGVDGTYHGDNTTCATTPPGGCPQPPTGACCLDGGACTVVWEPGCLDLGGIYQGDGTDCATTPCPLTLTTSYDGGSNATSAGAGAFFDITALDPQGIVIDAFQMNSPAAVGTEMTVHIYIKLDSFVGFESDQSAWVLLGEVQTTAAGLGERTPVPIGGLHIGPNETWGIRLGTENGGHRYNSTATTTTPHTNSHLQIDLGRIQNNFWGTPLAGNPLGWNGTVLYTVGATIATGACCLPDGSCDQLREVICVGRGGDYHGDNTDCATTPPGGCPQPPTGACCFNDGSCAIHWIVGCTDLNGTYMGDNTDCAGVSCPFVLETLPRNNGITAANGGIFLDLTASGGEPLSILRIDHTPNTAAGNAFNVEVWTYPGPYLPNYADPTGWTLHDTISTTSQGTSTPIALNLATPLEIEAGQTLGVYLISVTGGLSYTTGGASAPSTYIDANLTLFSEHVRTLPWAGSINTPRVLSGAIYYVLGGDSCYANCDNSTTPPILNVDDFTCFINEFAAAQSLPHAQQVEHYANCDGSTTAPVLNVDDFTCFINAFAAGCP